MTKLEKKLSISIKSNHPDIKFDIHPIGKITHNGDQIEYETMIDVNRRSQISIDIISRPNNDSYLQITKISVNGLELDHYNSFMSFIVNGQMRKTHGWLDDIGSCIINIHYNPVFQNLINFLLSNK